jgi:hypothetical protein
MRRHVSDVQAGPISTAVPLSGPKLRHGFESSFGRPTGRQRRPTTGSRLAEHLLDTRIGVVEVGGDVLDAQHIGGFPGFAALLDRYQACARDTVRGDDDLLPGRDSVDERGKAGVRVVEADEVSHA